MTATFIGSRLSGQSLRNYISPVSTFYALVLVGSQCHVILSDFGADCRQITSLFFMSIHLNVYFSFLAQIFSIKLGPYCIWFSAEDNMIDRLCGIARYCNTSAGVIPLCSFLLPSHNYLIDSDAKADMNFQG